MRLPNFLVIGGMKCGSTTLFRDLDLHPGIFLAEKESNYLVREEADTNGYGRLFDGAGDDQICGEVSTVYSMLPDVDGVAERAARLLPPDTKIVYVVREPVSRAISHHYHMYSWHGAGKMERDAEAAFARHRSLIDYSRYFMQLEPWVERFGKEAVRVVVFEEYVARRAETIGALCEFLGVVAPPDDVHFDGVHNRGDGKPVTGGIWGIVRQMGLYRNVVRPFLSHSMREKLCASLLPKAPERPDPPSLETVDRVIAAVRDDAQQLQEFLGREKPIWDFEAVRQKFEPSEQLPAAA